MHETFIPISGKEPLRRELNGVTYLFRPPVGAVESEVKKIQSSVMNPRPYLQEAMKRIDSEHKGKKWAAGERIQSITEEATRLAEDRFWDNYTDEINDEKRDKTFDIICAGWEGDGYKLKDGEKPSDHVIGAIKESHVLWYLDLMQLSGEDRKNLLQQPASDSPLLQESSIIAPSVRGRKKKNAVV